jgi:glycerol uptake facilitator-like aquaporin
MKINNLVRKSISESMGVMIFVTSIVAAHSKNPTFYNLALASTLAVMILLTSGVSGGHLNPAVSLFFFARKEIDISTLVSYWIAQLSGAALGLYLGFALSGTPVQAITAPAGIPANAVFIGELLSTTVLVIIIHRLASTKRAQLIPFAVGLWVLAASTFTLTGAQANPAVTFALMLRDGFSQGNLGIVLAEFAGALLALLYILLLDDKVKKSKKKK